MSYHGQSAKKLISEVVSLAIHDAKKGQNDALLWLYTEPCDTWLLLLGAIEPRRFRSEMRKRYGLPRGFSAVTEKPRPLYGTIDIAKPSHRKTAAPQKRRYTIETVEVAVPHGKVWACQYGFKALLSLPACAKMCRRCAEDVPTVKAPYFQKPLSPYVLDFSVWGVAGW